jgi:pimeloyl-ACP methyl ester carboxylesterase
MTPFAVHRFKSFDGTDIAYYTGGKPDGPALVLCNGLGGDMVVWRPLVRRLASHFRLISWDYRGLYASAPAKDPRAYAIPDHARDLQSLLRHETVQTPVIVGWSMGVQVALELHRTEPDVARALIAIHGTSGHPLRTAFDSSIAQLVSPLAFGGMRLLGRSLGRVGPTLARSSLVAGAFVWAGQRLGMMAPEFDVDVFADLAEEWSQMDLATYAEIFRQMNEHSADDLLGSIRTPALIIAGGRDRLTPAHLSARMASELSDAVLHVVEEATHFGLLEYPDAIVGCIESYLEGRVGIALG